MWGGQQDVTVTKILDKRILKPTICDVTLPEEKKRMILDLYKDPEAAVGAKEFSNTEL